jgi:hypothetical protein
MIARDPTPVWIKVTVVVAAVMAIAMLNLLADVTRSALPDAKTTELGPVLVLVAGGLTLSWAWTVTGVSLWLRIAVALTAMYLAIAIVAWVTWGMIMPHVEWAEPSLALVEKLPAPWIALGLGGVVLLAALVLPQGRRGAPRWLHGVVVFALAYLLLVAAWLPLVADRAPIEHGLNQPVLPWILDFIPLVLMPPAMVAAAITALVEWRPRWVENLGDAVPWAGAAAVTLLLVAAIGARTDLSVGSRDVYANFAHVLFSVAVFALVALLALAAEHARAMAAGRRDRTRPAPWVQRGVVVVAPGADREVGYIVDRGLLGGMRTTAGAFVLRTAAGDLPVPAGARLDVAIPSDTAIPSRGRHTLVLAEGYEVEVTGFVAPPTGAEGPFRSSRLPVPGPGGLVVSVPRSPSATVGRDVLLVIWRPCVVFLLVAVLAALPGVIADHGASADDLSDRVYELR